MSEALKSQSLPADPAFSVLEQALMSSARGRAFLADYLQRNRGTETQSILSAIERLENAVRMPPTGSDFERFQGDVLEMARRLSDTRQQIAAIRAEGLQDGPIEIARGELDAIVRSTESHTHRILEAAEQIQEIAWTLREGGLAVETCDAIDQRAIDIYVACSFQDLTSQRIRKVIEAIVYLEDRINSMIDIWGFSRDELPAAHALPIMHDQDGRLQQEDVDLALLPTAVVASVAFKVSQDAEEVDVSVETAEPTMLQPEPQAVAMSPVIPEGEIISSALPVDEPAASIDADEDAFFDLSKRLAVIDDLPLKERIAEFE
jgi:hypothetical protein